MPHIEASYHKNIVRKEQGPKVFPFAFLVQAKQKEMTINSHRIERVTGLGKDLTGDATISRSAQRDIKAFRLSWENTSAAIKEKEKILAKALECAPPQRYIEAMRALTQWLQSVEAVLRSEEFFVTEVDDLEDQLQKYKV